MSTQNQKTLEAYDKAAVNYLNGVKQFGEKEEKWTQGVIEAAFSDIPKGGKVFEVGSANGNIAKRIQKLGLNVTVSDVADGFLSAIKKNGFKPIKFNLLKDSFPDKYNAIICWKVFVHFTEEDVREALTKCYEALESGGICVFSVIDRLCKDKDSEWADFSGIYHIGVERFFNYYSEKEMATIVERTPFRPSEPKTFIAENGIKWLVYTLKKAEMNIDEELKRHIETEILPIYNKNEAGHGIRHIECVIARSFELVEENNLSVDSNIVYTVAAFHDLGHHIDPKKHEIISAEMMMKDASLPKYFTYEELKTIKEAIEDHRASGGREKPRSIYGEIISSADRNTTVEACLSRSYSYGKRLKPDATDEELFERAHYHLSEKFGVGGYAKFFFKDTKYEQFLKDIRELLSDKQKFIDAQREYIARLKKEHKN
ncbi:methyltransferase domain-containing protein [Candidatus Saccharibacteria bacterium]|nr:methyltransferase domain-containing protein [Candidatus Saccharibacteria bacterium]